MNNFVLFAQPWWVNILFVVPFFLYFIWKEKGLQISKRTLLITALFGLAFGFIEASVVIYLRAAVGLLPGYNGTLADVANLSLGIYQQAQILQELPQSLLKIEFIREAATIVMLASIALLTAKRSREQWAIFLWTFAAWELFYYLGLWATVRWPLSLLTPDVLFLIPVPWFSQVWYPLFVSVSTMIVVIFLRREK